jgi:hypothetical protein
MRQLGDAGNLSNDVFTPQQVIVSIHPQFAAWLEKPTRGSAGLGSFPRWPGNPAAAKADCRWHSNASWSARVSKAGCCEKPTALGRSQSILSFHSLRHMFNAAKKFETR